MQKNISLDLFQNTNSLQNNLFNFLYRKIIFKNDNSYECYLKNGYQKIGNIDDKYIKNIIRDLNAQSQNIPKTTTQIKLKKNTQAYPYTAIISYITSVQSSKVITLKRVSIEIEMSPHNTEFMWLKKVVPTAA